MKRPEVRPTAARLLERLAVVLRPASIAASLLQAVNQAQVQQQATEAAAQSATCSAIERHHEIFASATKTLNMVADPLGQSIRDNAPSAIWSLPTNRGYLGSSVRLEPATLGLSSVKECLDDNWGHYKPKFQVIAHASIEVRMPPDRFGYEGRSHSLWFCDAQKAEEFRWYETAFMFNPLVQWQSRMTPFALAPGEDAGKALSRVATEFQVAWPFTPIEPGGEMEFVERWIRWFALAVQGQLVHPHTMPEYPVGIWRQ